MAQTLATRRKGVWATGRMKALDRWGEKLGAGKRKPLRWLDRAGFEPCVRVASPRI